MTKVPARLPFFVYGTLRPEQGNDHCWQGYARAVGDGLSHVNGFRLVHNGAFPYALPCPGDAVVGAVIVPTDDTYEYVLDRMDRLEGYPSFYDRVVVSVLNERTGKSRGAWMYTPARPADYERLRTVPNNDWSAFCAGLVTA